MKRCCFYPISATSHWQESYHSECLYLQKGKGKLSPDRQDTRTLEFSQLRPFNEDYLKAFLRKSILSSSQACVQMHLAQKDLQPRHSLFSSRLAFFIMLYNILKEKHYFVLFHLHSNIFSHVWQLTNMFTASLEYSINEKKVLLNA